MREHKKNNMSGITLIALVVTVIVLLLLAGISVQMVTTNNGIIQRTVEAKEESNAIEIKERIKLSYYTVVLKNDEDYTKEQLMTALQKEFETNYDVDVSDDKNWILKAHGQQVTIPAGKNEKTFVSQISATNYGDEVVYTAPNGVNEWKVFYNDGSNVYIITSNFAPRNKIDMEAINSTPGMAIRNSYDNDETIIGYPTWSGDIWNSPGYCYGADFVDRLTDNANWSNFANGTSAGKRISNSTATGGPTLEMWIASWNAKGYTPLYYKKETKQRDAEHELNTDDYDAYKVGNVESPDTYTIGVDSNGRTDKLFFPESGMYWLASTSAANDDYWGMYQNGPNAVMVVSGGVSYCAYAWEYNGDGILLGANVRPVVCLPSDIIGSKDSLGRWKLE